MSERELDWPGAEPQPHITIVNYDECRVDNLRAASRISEPGSAAARLAMLKNVEKNRGLGGDDVNISTCDVTGCDKTIVVDVDGSIKEFGICLKYPKLGELLSGE